MRSLFLALFLAALLLPLRAAPPALAGAPSAPSLAPSVVDGLVGYWPFDEGSGATSIDYGGGGNNATLHSPAGFTSSTAPTEFANPFALSSSNNASSYASAPGNIIDTLPQFTIAFWVRINAQAPFPDMDLVTLPNGKAWFGYYNRDNLFFEITLGTVGFRSLSLSHPVTDGRYHHIAGSFDGRFMQFFIDGQIVNRHDTLDPLFPANGPSAKGQGMMFSSPTLPLNGALDDVRIYSRALSNTEITRLVFSCGSVSEIPQAECHALADLYLSTNGAGWKNHTGWLQTNTPCSWYGVLCNNGHVFLIGLPNNNLSGELPLSLNDLAGLNSLGLSDNNLSGPIPPLLSGLTQLQTLDLSRNHLTGALPALLGSLPNLSSLLLGGNALSGDISPLITRLNRLTALNISYNALNPTDSAVRAFLNATQPNWAATQTVPPANIQAQIMSSTSVALIWATIPYTADGGFYEVLASPGTGQYTSAGKTADKKASAITITGLQAGKAYSFLVRTFTPKHAGQPNDVTSDTSDTITATPAPNQPPVAANDSYTTSRDAKLTVDAAHGLLANDSDPDHNPLQIGAISTVSTGSMLALNPDGSFSYTPAPGFVGTETLSYQASDGQALSNQATVSFTVTPKPTVATITIALDVQPDSKTNFSFAGSLGAFLLDDITPQDGDAYSSSKTFTLPAGTYTVTEQLPSGWANANISCSPPANTIADLAKNQIAISAAAGANITCTFVTQRAGQLIAGAYNDHNHNQVRNSTDEWLPGWQMQLHSGLSGQTTTQTTDSQGRAVFADLRPGDYTICEIPPAGWYNITPGSLSPTFGQPCYSVTIAPGQAVWARFGNSNTPLRAITTAAQTGFSDVVICDLPATDDAGNAIAPAYDPWEAEEDAAGGATLFLPLLLR